MTASGLDDLRIYVGGDAQAVQGRRFNPLGPRCFSPLYRSTFQAYQPVEAQSIVALLDSGAFSDRPEKRLDPAGALDRQMRWEVAAREAWQSPAWTVEALVSYDRLIDETWADGARHKRRWSLADAESAMQETIAAGAFLASQRKDLAPRRLVLAIQGVDHIQQEECAYAVLAHADPADWLGLGGWCILGRSRSWLPVFWATAHRVVPLVAAHGLKRVHLFGVTWLPALGGLLWLCDQHGLALSTDSAAPMIALTLPDLKRSGARADTWEGNIQWWRDSLAALRSTDHYREPPARDLRRQGLLFPG